MFYVANAKLYQVGTYFTVRTCIHFPDQITRTVTYDLAGDKDKENVLAIRQMIEQMPCKATTTLHITVGNEERSTILGNPVNFLTQTQTLQERSTIRLIRHRAN